MRVEQDPQDNLDLNRPRIVKKFGAVSMSALMVAEFGYGGMVGGSVDADALRVFSQADVLDSYHFPQDLSLRTTNRFALDQTPLHPTEQISESMVKSWQPPKPWRGLIAYPWTKNQEVDGSWSGSYWEDNHSNPPETWINHLLPIFKTNPDGAINPVDQLYSSNDPAYWHYVLEMSKYMNLPITFLSNWGIGSKSDIASQGFYEYANSDQNPNPQERLSPLFDGIKVPKVKKIVRWINHYKSYADKNPSALRDPDNGELVVSVYSDNTAGPELYERWHEAAEQTGVEEYIRPYEFADIKDFLAGADGSNKPAGLFPYTPARPVETVYQDGKAYTQISAKFDKFNGTEGPALAEDPQRFKEDVEENVKNPPELTTFIFDEIGEGTALAPGLRVIFTKYGPYIDWQRSYGYFYVNLLHNILPPMPEVVSDLQFAMQGGKSRVLNKPDLTNKKEQSVFVWADNRVARITLPQTCDPDMYSGVNLKT